MNRKIIGALVTNDFFLHFRDVMGILNMIGLFVFIGLFFFLPASVNETFEVGLYSPGTSGVFPGEINNEALAVRTMNSEDALKKAIIKKELKIGLVLPGDLLMKEKTADRNPEIKVYFSTDFPGEFKESIVNIIRELAHMTAGRPLPVHTAPIVLGPDMAGKQIPMRNRMFPLFAVVILIMEILGLANLVTYEVENKTILALLVTPVKPADLFAAKMLTGTGMAFSQVILFMAVTGGLGSQTFIVIVTLFLGALMVTGLAFLIASAAKDFMSVIAWGFLAVFLLSIPPITVLIPGAISGWVKIFPSFYLVDTINRALNYNTGWSDNWYNLLIILAFDGLFILLGTKAIRRRIK
jgi:ABC-2 type transport system permease protein